MYDQLVENKLMTDNEGEFSTEEPVMAQNVAGEASIEASERQSRKLYVITEES